MRAFQKFKGKRILLAVILLVILTTAGITGTYAAYVSAHDVGTLSLTVIAKDITPPELTVITPDGKTPQNPTTVTTGSYTVTGTVVDHGTGVESVVVNGTTATLNSDGTWSATIPLDGSVVNEITVVATDKMGNHASEKRYVRVIPILAERDTWFSQGNTTVKRASITQIEIVDSYIPTGEEDASWDASAGKVGSITAYVDGTKLIIAGNGTGCVYANPNSRWAFSHSGNDNFSSLTHVYGGSVLNTSKVTTMERMFEDAASLITLDVSTWDLSRVQSLKAMFQCCYDLTTLDVSKWNVSRVTDLTAFMNMAADEQLNYNLKTLDVSNWDVANNTSLRYTFSGLAALQQLPIGTWNTSKVTTLYGFAMNCFALTELDIATKTVTHDTRGTYTAWDVSKVETAYSAFAAPSETNPGVMQLTSLDLASWNPVSLQTAAHMLHNCVNITEVDLGSWNTPVLQDTNNMFLECASLVDVTLDGWYAPALKNAKSMFQGCRSLKKLVLEGWETESLIDLYGFCWSCTQLESIDLDSLELKNVTSLAYAFANCYNLQRINLDGIDTPNLTDINAIFSNCYTLQTIDVSDFDTQNVKAFSHVFEYCSDMTEIVGLENWDTSKGVTFMEMFEGCHSLKELDLSSFNTKAAIDEGYVGIDPNEIYTAMTKMFSAMPNLERITLGKEFRFDGSGSNASDPAVLPTPSASYIPGATGKWYRITDWAEFAPANVPDTLLATYVAVPITHLYPTLAEGDTWFSQGNTTVKRASITQIEIVDSYIPTGEESTSWDASAGKTGKVTAYVIGTKLIIAGNGTGCVYANPNSKWAFSHSGNDNFSSLTHVYGGSVLNTSKVTTMERMFEDAASLITVDVSTWDLSRVQSLKAMFQCCYDLTTLDVSKWNVSRVTDLTAFMNMAADERLNYNLTTLDVSNWDVANNTSLRYTFSGLAALQQLPIGTWNTSKVTTLYGFVMNCFALTELDIATKTVTHDTRGTYTAWDVSKVETAYSAFAAPSETNTGVMQLTSLDLASWNPVSLQTAAHMLHNCVNITAIDLENWNTPVLQSLDSVFLGCTNLKEINFSGWKAPQLNNIYNMFVDCFALESVDLSNWQTPSLTSARAMFLACENLQTLTLDGWVTGSIEDMSYFCQGCKALESIDLSGINLSKITNLSHAFADCSKLCNINLSGVNTSNLTNLDACFNDCRALQTVDVSDLDTQNVTQFSQIFEHCTSLTEIIGLENWNTSKGVTFTEMFSDCRSLRFLNLSSFDTRAAVDGGYVGPITGEVYNAMTYMFSGMTALEQITLGANFRFDGNGSNTSTPAVLPTPSSSYISGATGKWYRISDWVEFAPAEVPNGAGTYVACPS